MKGFFGIGVENLKTKENLGTLFRSAYNFGAAFVFVIGRRYCHQSSDTVKAFKSIPFYQYENKEEFLGNVPKDCRLIGIEIDDRSKSLMSFIHPDRAVYILGPEDGSLSIKERCWALLTIPTHHCLNVSVAGACVMYDRLLKQENK